MTIKKSKYRRNIEIYFVLYLAALILLIPTQKEKEQERKNSSDLDIPFAIKVEKSVLFCRMALDSVPNVLFIDSLNTIFFTGNIENIQYEIIVEDELHKNRIKLVSNVDNKNQFFQLKDNPNQKITYFYWKPPIFDKINKSYIVYILAKANHIETGEELLARAQFALVINYYDRKTGLPIIQEEKTDVIAQNNVQIPFSLSDVNFSFQYDKVQTISNFDWENTIFVLGGLNPLLDMQKNVEIKLNHNLEGNVGSAYIANYTANSIVVRGKAPNYGNMIVNLSFKRKIDNTEFQISFPVISESLANAEVPEVMYPDIKYTIKPNLPSLPGYETKVIIRDDETIRFQQYSSDNISFTPNYSDTNANVYLERYINNKLIGQRIRLNIKKFPAPVIIKISKASANSVILQTMSYGLYRNRENTVERLDIQGNGTYREQFGKLKADREKLIWTQFFEITPQDPNKPFSFKVSVIDRSGNRSSIENYEN